MVEWERRRLSKLEIKGMRRRQKEEKDGDSPKPVRVRLALIWSLGECLWNWQTHPTVWALLSVALHCIYPIIIPVGDRNTTNLPWGGTCTLAFPRHWKVESCYYHIHHCMHWQRYRSRDRRSCITCNFLPSFYWATVIICCLLLHFCEILSSNFCVCFWSENHLVYVKLKSIKEAITAWPHELFCSFQSL